VLKNLYQKLLSLAGYDRGCPASAIAGAPAAGDITSPVVFMQEPGEAAVLFGFK